MINGMEMAPADPILGLSEAFKADARENKVNLGVGVYKDEKGGTPILESVRLAEQKILQADKTKSYLGIDGLPELGPLVQELLFGADSDVLSSGRAASAQTPGGTGGLRVAGDFLAAAGAGTIWLPDPTWANHKGVFTASGLKLASYPYYNAETKALDFEAMVAALSRAASGDVILFHACCHNPSGMDPSPEQWQRLAEILAAGGATVLFDFAYQGFGDGLDEDAAGVRAFAAAGMSMLVVSSFSKNFSLYNERIGALTVVAGSAKDAAAAMSHVKRTIRTNYSNPPAHGGKVVATILADPTLKKMWIGEVKTMRDRINGMRELFVKTLADCGVQGDYGFITTQKGMFSFSGLSPEQVNRLRDEFAIYIVGSGRINVAGMTPSNITGLCQAIKAVTA